MTKTKHTPGPWVFDTYSRAVAGTQVFGKDGWPVANCNIKCSGRLGSDNAANARLIVEAPRLLELVKELHRFHHIGQNHEAGSKPDICFICDTIAKIEGDTP